MTTYSLLIKGPFKDTAAVREHIESRVQVPGKGPSQAAVIILEAVDLSTTTQFPIWRVEVDIAPWRVVRLYDWYGSTGHDAPQPDGSLMLFTEVPTKDTDG